LDDYFGLRCRLSPAPGTAVLTKLISKARMAKVPILCFVMRRVLRIGVGRIHLHSGGHSQIPHIRACPTAWKVKASAGWKTTSWPLVAPRSC